MLTGTSATLDGLHHAKHLRLAELTTFDRETCSCHGTVMVAPKSNQYRDLLSLLTLRRLIDSTHSQRAQDLHGRLVDHAVSVQVLGWTTIDLCISSAT